MAKAKKREPLVVGQRVWLEELSWYVSRDDRRSVKECEVVKVNKTSAYVVHLEDLERYRQGERVCENRINQKTFDASNSVSRFNVWLTKEAFERNVNYNVELKKLRAKSIHLVNQMNADELRKVLEI